MIRKYLTLRLSRAVNIYLPPVVPMVQYGCSTYGISSLYPTNYRSLDHSTIIYESPQVGLGTVATSTSAAVSRTAATNPPNTGTPLLRIAPCSKDANLLATFHLDSSTVLVLDIRQPGKELYNLVAHTGNINASISFLSLGLC
jgi:hypothetical protein